MAKRVYHWEPIITPSPLTSSDRIRIETAVMLRFVALVKAELEIIERKFKAISDQFSAKNRPEWVSRMRKVNRIEVTGTTSTRPVGSRVFGWLSLGTEKRYATMFDQYTPRTSRRSASLRPHTMSPPFVKNLWRNPPIPGIQAREWEFMIAYEEQPLFIKLAQRVMDDLANDFVKNKL